MVGGIQDPCFTHAWFQKDVITFDNLQQLLRMVAQHFYQILIQLWY